MDPVALMNIGYAPLRYYRLRWTGSAFYIRAGAIEYGPFGSGIEGIGSGAFAYGIQNTLGNPATENFLLQSMRLTQLI